MVAFLLMINVDKDGDEDGGDGSKLVKNAENCFPRAQTSTAGSLTALALL